ncbi:hypothetical protein HPL003_27325 [Paenibacillus terrae HPL-003]|uniref:Uncharacterized protein n=1 Tax=Paenibacillus terrae (strain HPL-003) TaxID=985665 RepID=G7VSG8_PAETH|nr:hypothetical protein HPL003_27325 [Paenibacillus terrae HPL-003]
MTINNPIFGELEYKYSWSKDTTIHFFGKETETVLMITTRKQILNKLKYLFQIDTMRGISFLYV